MKYHLNPRKIFMLKRSKMMLIIRILTIIFSITTINRSQAQLNQLSLDGTWDIIFDDENVGKNGFWQTDSAFDLQSKKREIEVPSCWELIEQDYEGVAFYRQKFYVPENWDGKVIRLQFGAVNYLAEVWLNDEVVGFHEGGFTPFEFRVDEMIKPGESNVLTMRVVGPIILSEKEIDGVKQMETPQWRGGITGGIWQSVILLATDEVYVDDVFIEPNINNNTATLHVALDHTGTIGVSVDIELEIYEVGGGTERIAIAGETLMLHPGKNTKSWLLHLPKVQYWSPDSPQLYEARVSVKHDDSISDRWHANFGMRELTIRNKDFYLNGKRIYIKASFLLRLQMLFLQTMEK